MQPAGLCLAVLVVGLLFASASAQGDPQEPLEVLTTSKKEGLIVRERPDSNSGKPVEGKIDAVFCLENNAGQLTHIAYHNTKTGLELEGCGTGKDWTDDASKTLRLAEGESIISVETCKAGPRQSVKVTFKTDLGQAMTCGAARKGHGYDSPRKSRDGYGSYSDVDDQRHDDDEEDSEYESRRSDYGVRQLLQAQSAHKPRGSKCTMYIASKQPPWSAVPNWWELDGTQPQPDGAYIGLVGIGYDAYYAYEGGRYYKNLAMYQLQLEAYTNAQGSFPFQPYYYYSVVYPLASFEADCGPKGLIKHVYNMRYNGKFVGKDTFPENAVPAVLEVNLGEGQNGAPVPCPDAAAIVADLNTVLTRVQAASNGVIGGYVLDVYTTGDCILGDGTGSARALLQAAANTTIVITITFVPAPGQTSTDVANFLSGYTDLCDIQSACANTSIESIIITFNAPVQPASRRLLKVATLQRSPWNLRGLTAGRRSKV